MLQIGIHTGGDIDTKLNISIDNPAEDNSGIEYTSSTSGTALNIKKAVLLQLLLKVMLMVLGWRQSQNT